MLNSQQIGLMLLIRSAILHKSETLPPDFSLAKELPMIKRQQITSIALEGAFLCGCDIQSPEMQELTENSCALFVISDRQLNEVAAISRLFDENQIDYVFLKGINLKKLYAEPHLREMADADILIRMEQYGTIKKLLKSHGYVCGTETDHELHWESPNLHFELHKRMIPGNNMNFAAYFDNAWDKAYRISESSNAYAFSAEDEMIFYVVHFAKHYRDGGIGSKHLADLYVFLSAHPDLDLAYVKSELEKMSLDVFFENLQKTLDVWFGDGEQTPATETILGVVLSSTAFGNGKLRYIAASARYSSASGSLKAGRRQRIRYLFFPPAEAMKRQFPVLYKAPILLPLFYVVRWVDALANKRKTVKERYLEAKTVTPQVIEDYCNKLAQVGLEFEGTK